MNKDLTKEELRKIYGKVSPFEFKDKLIIESGNMGFGERCLTDYGIVRNEYQTLVDSNKKNIAKTLIKKYNNQKKQ